MSALKYNPIHPFIDSYDHNSARRTSTVFVWAYTYYITMSFPRKLQCTGLMKYTAKGINAPNMLVKAV